MLSKISPKKIPSLRLCLTISGAILVLSPFYQSIAQYLSYPRNQPTPSSVTDSQTHQYQHHNSVMATSMATSSYPNQKSYLGGTNIFWYTLIPNALLLVLILGLERSLNNRDAEGKRSYRQETQSDETSTKDLPDPTQKYRMQIYKIALQESLTSGGIKSVQNMEALKEMRQAINISDTEHYSLLTDLIAENPALLSIHYPQTLSTTEPINSQPFSIERTTIRRNPKSIITNKSSKIRNYSIANCTSHENQSHQS